MKNNIDSNFAIAILVLVAACVGFSFWFYTVQDSLVAENNVMALSFKKKSQTIEKPRDGVDAALGAVLNEQNQVDLIRSEKEILKSFEKIKSVITNPKDIEVSGNEVVFKDENVTIDLPSDNEAKEDMTYRTIMAADDKSKVLLFAYTPSPDDPVGGYKNDLQESYIVDLKTKEAKPFSAIEEKGGCPISYTYADQSFMWIETCGIRQGGDLIEYTTDGDRKIVIDAKKYQQLSYWVMSSGSDAVIANADVWAKGKQEYILLRKSDGTIENFTFPEGTALPLRNPAYYDDNSQRIFWNEGGQFLTVYSLDGTLMFQSDLK